MKKSKFTTKRLVMTAMLACMAFVLNTFVHFPAMAPFQHFVNAMAAVTVGPWLGSLAGFLTGVFRIACGSDIGSITGAIFGPILGGLLYRRFGSFAAVWAGEVIGTGVVGAMASYPFFKMFYGLDAQSPFYFIPFYTPSAMMGASMGVAALVILKKNGMLARMQQALQERG
ncbi:MAG: energy coupling factor transporter S component ThiW [Anaerotignum sp.]|nr:energy coupling factor transporter S component ThiW [Anaerotignum sp.]